MDKETTTFNFPNQETKTGAFDLTQIKMETLIETFREANPEKYEYFKTRANKLAALAKLINSQAATNNSHIMTGETFSPTKQYIEEANLLELEIQAYLKEHGNREIRDCKLHSFISYLKEILKKIEQGEDEDEDLNFFLTQYNAFQQKNQITEIENREILEILFEINLIRTRYSFDQSGKLNVDWFDYRNKTLVLYFYKKVSQIIENDSISINLRKKLEIKLHFLKANQLPVDNDFWELLLIAEKERSYIITESSSLSDKLTKKAERAKTREEKAAIAMALAEKIKTEKAEKKERQKREREERRERRRYERAERERWVAYGKNSK